MLKNIRNFLTETKYQLDFFDINKINDISTILIIGDIPEGNKLCKNILKDKFGENYRSSGGIIIDPNHDNKKSTDESIIRIGFENSSIYDKIDDMNLDCYLNSDGKYVVFNNCFTYTFYKYIGKIINSRKIKIVITQFPYSIEQNYVKEIDFIFVQNGDYYHSCKRIYDNYANYKDMFKCFENFNKLLNCVTKNCNYLVIDNKADSVQLDKKFYYYGDRMNVKQTHISNFEPVEQVQVRVDDCNGTDLENNWCAIV
mgnify:CR=1 FL=1